MDKTAAPAGSSADQKWKDVDPRTLVFDIHNPRFMDEPPRTEEEIIKYLSDYADVDELIQSIMSAGYIDFEPLIVLRDGNVVLEGNRRLAALRLIDDAKLRERLKIRLPDIDDPAAFPKTVRVVLVDNRDEARGYIGFKHINGPFKWDAQAKAQYAAEWLGEGGNIETISRTLGDNHSTVRRLVNGWFALKQARELGFNIDQISRKPFAFSHLYTALTRPDVRKFVGLNGEDLSAPPKVNPIPKDHEEQFMTLMSWLYGQEDRGEPTLIRSQNPNLNQLTRVLGNTEARLMLMTTRNLETAHERLEPQSKRFDEALVKTATSCEDAAKYVSAYEGDPTLLQMAESIANKIDSLLLVMREKAGQGKVRKSSRERAR
jgi:hypothetical protein